MARARVDVAAARDQPQHRGGRGAVDPVGGERVLGEGLDGVDGEVHRGAVLEDEDDFSEEPRWKVNLKKLSTARLPITVEDAEPEILTQVMDVLMRSRARVSFCRG